MRFIQPSRFAALALITSLAGCTVFPDGDPPRVMDIPLPEPPAAQTSPVGKTLRVDTPQATEPFDSSRILTKPTSREYQVYANVRWRDTAPVLMREVMIGTLRQDGRFDGVVNETSPTASDLTLASELSGFHSETFGDQPRIIITLYSQLLDNRSRKTLCTGSFQITTKSTDADIETVVRHFGEGSEELSRQLRNWLDDCLG
ncbi:MAG: ABC-type transport auxiliary lipoprotein family protein [Pseudomonadota bacterium]